MKILIIILLTVLIYGCFNKTPLKTGLEGNTLPSFTLLLADSVTYLNTSKMKNNGQQTILFFYSPHCPYCRAQMKEMIEDIQMFKRVQLYAITDWPFNEMKEFITYFKIKNYPNITAASDVNHFLTRYFSLSQVPFTAIYGKDRRLKQAFIGNIDSKTIMKAVDDGISFVQ